MTEGAVVDAGETPASPAPALVPATTLSAEHAEAKTLIESWIPDPQSPYWRGNEQLSAASIQDHYRQLVRGELAGLTGPITVDFGPDVDVPLDASRYDVSAAPGARSMNEADLEHITRFLPVAYAAGFGQSRVAELVGWALTTPGDHDAFVEWALGKSWSARQIAVVVKFIASHGAPQGRAHQEASPGEAAPPAAPARPRPPSAAIAAEKAELEQQMGDPGSAYWRGERVTGTGETAGQIRYRQIIAAQAGG